VTTTTDDDPTGDVYDLDSPFELLGFPTAIYNKLGRLGIKSLRELLNEAPNDRLLGASLNIGSVNIIDSHLSDRGLRRVPFHTVDFLDLPWRIRRRFADRYWSIFNLKRKILAGEQLPVNTEDIPTVREAIAKFEEQLGQARV
jgi:hypothetical protein